jgi:hypothetical protein
MLPLISLIRLFRFCRLDALRRRSVSPREPGKEVEYSQSHEKQDHDFNERVFVFPHHSFSKTQSKARITAATERISKSS